jgi:hypothetical protein
VKHRLAFIALATVLCCGLLGCSSSKTRDLMGESVSSTYKVKERGVFPYQGEVLRYTARHVKTRAELADAELRVEYAKKTDESREMIRIVAEGKSKPLISFIANIDDRAEVYIDASTWESIYSYKYLNENARERDFHVWFWPHDMRAEVERSYKGNTVKRETYLPQNTMDSVAWVYWIRSEAMEMGKQYTSHTFDGWTINHITLNVAKTEEVWTPLGFYPCHKIEIYRERKDTVPPLGALSGVYVDPETMVDVERYRLGTAWLATDEKRTPVRLSIHTALGEFDLLLKEVTELAK